MGSRWELGTVSCWEMNSLGAGILSEFVGDSAATLDSLLTLVSHNYVVNLIINLIFNNTYWDQWKLQFLFLLPFPFATISDNICFHSSSSCSCSGSPIYLIVGSFLFTLSLFGTCVFFPKSIDSSGSLFFLSPGKMNLERSIYSISSLSLFLSSFLFLSIILNPSDFFSFFSLFPLFNYF